MNRKEMACAAVGAVLGAAGCSPAVRSLVVPVANAEKTSSIAANAPAIGNTRDEIEVLLSLVSGTTKDASSIVFRLVPTEGWSISSSDPRLDVSIGSGHIATLVAPEYEKVHFKATVTISHPTATPYLLRCHVEGSCM
ncbi:MAG TPA: hypothetical protein VGF86_13160 [Candidatus Tumulicola sp.]|jgi:hypothetical protein